MVANGAVRRHGRQQRVTRGERRQGALPHQFLQFTVPGVLERAVIPRVRTNPVKGDGAVVEVQGRRGRHVRRGVVLVEIRRAVAKWGLLLDGTCHQVWCADRHGGHWKAMSTGLDLQLLQDWKNNCKLGSSAPKCDITPTNQPTDLDTKQQMAIGVFQLPLPALQLLDSLLLPLQHSDVVHRGLQNGPLIPAHVSEVGRRQRSSVRVSWPSDQLTARAKDSLWSLKPFKHNCYKDTSRSWWIGIEENVEHSGLGKNPRLTDRLIWGWGSPALWCDR